MKLRILDTEGDEVDVVGMVRSMQADFGDIFVSAAGKVIVPALDPDAAGICPRCGATYRSGFPACSDGQVPVRPLG